MEKKLNLPSYTMKLNKTVSDMLCQKCATTITSREERVDCDSCEEPFCLPCMNARKLDVTTRDKSKCLRIYCPDCRENKIDRWKEVSGLLYKLDLFNQNQVEKQAKNEDTMALFTRQLKTLETKMNALETKAKTNEPTKQTSYAGAVKQSNVKPAVVIKPKNKQQASKKTREEICNKVDKSLVNVCGTRNARKGGVVLRCESAGETEKVKQLFENKMGDEYDIVLPKVRLPRLRITNIDVDIPKDDILMELKKYNSQMEQMNLKLITVIGRKHHDNEYNDIIVEMNGNAYNKLKELGKLKLPWRECRIYSHLYLVRCYKCCGFFHKSDQCSINQKCHKCSGPHKYSECKSKTECCINCKITNVQYNMKLDTKHSAWSTHCPVLKRHQSKLANKLDYNSA
jgi:hypothetical protein